MNSGGSPGPDDYGLPPVDIEIPDDARELDRDVQAYYRELRAHRRRMRTRRLHAPLTRDGMVLPLLAGCLALTLLAGTLLTVFTATQGPFFASSRSAPGGAPDQVRAGGRLPNAQVLVGGEERPLRSLTGAVLALVPPNCGCQAPLSQLTRLTHQDGAGFYVVGIHGAQVARLAAEVGLRAADAVEDPRDALVSYYHPTGLTAILVRVNGTVAAVMTVQGHTAELAKAIRSLPAAGPQGLGATNGTPLAAAPTGPSGGQAAD